MTSVRSPFVNTLTIGSPGSGKSFGAARSAIEFPGAVYVADPHTRSVGQLVLEHVQGNVLFDQLSDLKHVLPLDILRPSCSPDAREAEALNHRSAQLFTEILMRRRSGEIAS